MKKRNSKKSKYRSKFERATAEFLRTNLIAFQYEPRRVAYTKTHFYTPDFYLTKKGIFIETKGRFTSSDRTKMEQVIAEHPELDIRLCFMSSSGCSAITCSILVLSLEVNLPLVSIKMPFLVR